MHLRPIPEVVLFTDALQAAGEISKEEFPAWPVLGIAPAIAGPNDLPPIQVFGEDGCLTRPWTPVSEEEEDQLIDAQAVTAGGSDTGGKGSITQWVHGEYIVGSETIRPTFTQWVRGGYFLKVPTKVPTG